MPRDEMMETRTCILQIQTPVHIGCDEVYDPTGFVVNREKFQLTVFDPTTFIAELSQEDRTRLSDICKQGTIDAIRDLYRFMDGRPAKGRMVDVCHRLIDEYRSIVDRKNGSGHFQPVIQKFEIRRTAFNIHSGQPYIPGSSIKGAIRNAYLNRRAALNPGLKTPTRLDRRRQREMADDQGLERELLDIKGRFIPGDPFRLLKVSDFLPVGDAGTRIVYAVNRKKNPKGINRESVNHPLEVLLPGSLFMGQISVHQAHRNAGIPQLKLDDLLAGLDFYQDEFDHQKPQLDQLKIPVPEIDKTDESEKLIRAGFHCGAESVTVKGHRKIRIRHSNGDVETRDQSTTIWFAGESSGSDMESELAPFGWMTLLAAATENQLKDQLAKKRDIANQKRDRIRKAHEKEAAHQAELAAMTPAQHDQKALLDQELKEKKAWEICERLPDYRGDEQLTIANALADFFKKHNRWTKKQCHGAKQWKKIQMLKRTLGEEESD